LKHIDEEDDTVFSKNRHTVDVGKMGLIQNKLGLVEIEHKVEEEKEEAKVQDEEEEEVISINDENLAPDEDLNGYLEELREKNQLL
jgi:hypothetical protein